ncbi:MAG: bifunctional SulP family inorganic anion transporter/carbonic anhydrase [Fimbriiglobus sp.]
MNSSDAGLGKTLPRDLTAGLVVFLVALPLCLGVALASKAPLLSGVLAGIVGGIIVGAISGSHTSVSGPAAGLAAIVAAQILALGSFPSFLMAVVLAGVIQIVLGVVRAGMLADFFPSSVIKGLLAAIGLLLILKQFPHLVGYDKDPVGESAFQQPDQANTFTEIINAIRDPHVGAMVIGFASVAILVLWGQWKFLKKSPVPAPLIVVLFGMGMGVLFRPFGEVWAMGADHFVEVPVAKNLEEFFGFLQLPDFSQLTKPAVYIAAFTIAAVASLETLLNLEAVDKIDPQQRVSPPSRELIAQGIGNVVVGLIGGIPVTSVIVRSSVNINAGARTKLSAIVHGVLLLVSVVFLATWLNMIPLSCLAAILIVTGVKLFSPKLIREMWSQGKYQFVPFATTIIAILFTDLLVGVVIGLGVSLSFILWSNLRRPMRRYVEKHLSGEVLRIELANQVSFLNRASLVKMLKEVPRGGDVLLDARNTDYIDPDVLDLLRDFTIEAAPARGVHVSLIGFREKYEIEDRIQYMDYSSLDLQTQMTPDQVLQVLKDGNERFLSGQTLTRNLGRQLQGSADGQHPIAVVLSCIDSRAPAEIVFDVGLGDILSIRIAGNVLSPEVLGSMEYGCAVAGAKLILVMGHTRCGAVTSAVEMSGSAAKDLEHLGCEHLTPIVQMIQKAIDPSIPSQIVNMTEVEKATAVENVVRANVQQVVQAVCDESAKLKSLLSAGQVAIVGAVYDVVTGEIEYLS